MRIRLCAFAVAFVLFIVAPSATAQQRGQQIFDFLNLLGQEAQRQQYQDQINQQNYQVFRAYWQACRDHDDLGSCDLALTYPQLNQRDRQTILRKRDAIVLKQQEEERQQQRQQQELQAAVQRNYNLVANECRQYVVASCDAALGSSLASPAEQQEFQARRAQAARYDADRAKCSEGSVSACDAALAFPIVHPDDRRMLVDWKNKAHLARAEAIGAAHSAQSAQARRIEQLEQELAKLQAPHPWLASVYGGLETVKQVSLPHLQFFDQQIHLVVAAGIGAFITALIALFGYGRRPAEGEQPPIEQISEAISTISWPFRILSLFRRAQKPAQAQPLQQTLQHTLALQPTQTLHAAGPSSLLQAMLKHERRFNSSYVVLTLKFSREAHQLIRARRIDHLTVLSGELTRPPPGAVEVIGMDWLFRLSGLVGAFGIIPSFIYGVAGGGEAAGALLFLCFGLLAVRFIGPRMLVKSWEAKDYTIKDFLRQPTVRLFADNPVFAKGMMEHVKEKISDLRLLLEDSKELPVEETIEL